MGLSDLLDGFDSSDISKAVALISEHKEVLAMLGQLPDYLDKVADGLAGAGDQAKAAAVALAGEDGKSGVRATLAESATALSSLVGSVKGGADKLADAAESAAKVPLMDGPASRLAGAAQELSSATALMAELAAGMEKIGDVLGQVATALGSLGDHLDDSGTQARGFASLGK